MSDFKTRLIDEKNELLEKTAKLNSFLNSENAKSINKFQLTMLRIQLNTMKTYLTCLEARIEELNL